MWKVASVLLANARWLSIILVAALTIAFFLQKVGLKSKAFSIDLNAARELAGNGSELPASIETVRIGGAKFPCFWLAAGRCIDGEIDFRSFVVRYSDKHIVIDPGHCKALHRKFLFARDFDDESYDRLIDVVNSAATLVFTHEHWDHVDGIFNARASEEIFSRSLFSDAQIESAHAHPKLKALSRRLNRNISSTHYTKVAPGIVIIPSAGHTPGSQIIYVRTINSNEFLFVGDIAYRFFNIENAIGKPLLTSLLTGEDNAAVGGQIITLHGMLNRKNLFIVPAHDPVVVADLAKRGIIDSIHK